MAQLEQQLKQATKANAELEKKMKASAAAEEQQAQEKAATGDSEVSDDAFIRLEVMLLECIDFISFPQFIVQSVLLHVPTFFGLTVHLTCISHSVSI